MEAFTTGRVSAAARKAWTAMRGEGNTFDHCPDGYEMIGWESQIAMARAMGRGAAAGKDKPAHRYDLIAFPESAAPARLAPRW